MLGILFNHYPDEVALSWFIRYHIYSGNRMWRQTAQELFGRSEHNPYILYANDLGFFCDQIPSELEITPKYIINKMTIFPLFKPFMPIERANRVIKGMVNDGLGAVRVGIGPNTGKIFLKEGPIIKICKACLENDKKNYGEAYLHRIHQIPGNFLCIKHNTPLHYFLVQIDKSNYEIDMDNFNAFEFEPYRIKQNLTKYYFSLGEDIEFVLSGALSNFSIDTVRERYWQRLQEKGYVVGSIKQHRIISEFNQSILISEFKQFYAIAFLEGLESNFEDENRKSWFRRMITGSKKFIHPIQHLLFIRFIFGGTKEFLRYSREYKPFGDGPYPCLNSIEDHYKKNVIQSCELKRSSHIINPVGVFKCDCGFVYSRKGPDKTENDRLICGKIMQYGHIWEGKFKEQVDKSSNTSYIAREMKCSRDTVIKYATLFGIIDKLNTKQRITSEQIKKITSFATKLDVYKEQITQHIINNPDDSRKQIRTALSKQYLFLGIRDKQWLEGILPQRNRYSTILKKSHEYIDWELRDEELLQKTRHIVILILLKEKPRRITRTLIAREANSYHGIFHKRIMKYCPRTEEYLLSCCETNEVFQQRKRKTKT